MADSRTSLLQHFFHLWDSAEDGKSPLDNQKVLRLFSGSQLHFLR